MRFSYFAVLRSTTMLWIGLMLVVQPVASIEILPRPLQKIMQASPIPTDAIAFEILPIGKHTLNRQISWRGNQAMHPASTMKLVTTVAALDLLGPDYHWTTRVFGTGSINQGLYTGKLIWQGSGDPKLVPEELALIMTKLRNLGIDEIDGQLVFDRHVYDPSVQQSAPDDGESTRAYNVSPDPLLFAFQTLSFTLSSKNRSAPEITYTPQLAGLRIQNLVEARHGACEDWNKTVQSNLSQNSSNDWVAQFKGEFSVNCPDASWNIVKIDPNQFLKMGIIAAWEGAGGKWRTTPQATSGTLPSEAILFVSHQGISLADAVKDTNKFSNNVMARHIFLTIGLEKMGQPATTTQSIAITKNWLQSRHLIFPELVLENGSGLSDIERISPHHLNALLQYAATSSYAETFIRSLPIAGVDGTMKHRLIDRLAEFINHEVVGRQFSADTTLPETLQKTGAYIKTGSLQKVRSISGYVVSKSGKVYAVSSMINHSQASSNGKRIHDAILSWVLDDCPNR